MAVLHLFGPSLRLAWLRGRWSVERNGEPVRRLRPREVDEIHCQGAVEIAPNARIAALARGVPVIFLTGDGRYRGRIEGPRGPSGALQVAQARWLGSPPNQLELARALVSGKLATSRSLLLAAQRRRQDDSIAAAAAALREVCQRVALAATVDAVRGHEGEGGARYFGVWGSLILSDVFAWTGRSRRPPRDPVNACLSYLYTLLAARVEDAIRTVGLLPGLGALHQPGPGRLPLVYDLVEEFRAPLVDRVVLRLVNRHQIAPEDFEDPAWRRPTLPAPTRRQPDDRLRPSGAVYLGSTARRLLVREFSQVLRSDLADADDGASVRADWLLQRQARRVARLVRGDEAQYRPFAWQTR